MLVFVVSQHLESQKVSIYDTEHGQSQTIFFSTEQKNNNYPSEKTEFSYYRIIELVQSCIAWSHDKAQFIYKNKEKKKHVNCHTQQNIDGTC